MDEIKNEFDNKKMIIRIALLVITILLVITGTSLAAYTWIYNGTNPNTINTVEVSMDFLESTSEIISITNALPMSDANGISQNEKFDFAVNTKSTQSTTINYTLSIEKLTADTGYTLLNDSDIKVYLEDHEGNQLVAPTLISSLSNYVLYTGSHTHNQSQETMQSKFRLKVWIDSSKESEAQNWTSSTKLQYKFKINASGSNS